MKELKFPLLNKDQIEVRVGQVSEYGYTLLLYKTSRTDSEILDQIVGIGNWQKKFYTLQGVGVGDTVRSIVVCSVGIYDEDKHEWVWKDDSGTEGNIEQDKSICSDAFKRASGGSCWGIGRELYYTGRIYVKGGTQKKQYGSGYELADKFARFEVKEISWNEKPLSLKRLVIVDENDKVVFSYPTAQKVSQTSEKVAKNDKQPIDEKYKTLLQNYVGRLSAEKYSGFFNWLFYNYNVNNVADLTLEQAKDCAGKLRL